MFIHQSLLSHRLVYNGGFSNFELPLLVRNSIYVTLILCGLGYKVWSTFITKFRTTALKTSKVSLYSVYKSGVQTISGSQYKIWIGQHEYITAQLLLFDFIFFRNFISSKSDWFWRVNLDYKLSEWKQLIHRYSRKFQVLNKFGCSLKLQMR